MSASTAVVGARLCPSPAPLPWTLARRACLPLACVAALLSGCGNGSPQADANQIEEDLGVDNVQAIDRAGNPVRTKTAAVRQAIPHGSGAETTQGVFGAPFNWPLIAIHMALTPDGRVMNFGSDLKGKQGAQLYYAVWDPSLGQGKDSFLILSNTTSTNVFCAAQALLPETGELLVVGGTQGGGTQEGIADAGIFSPSTNSFAKTGSMSFERWYGTVVTTVSGEHLVLGGRSAMTDADTAIGSSTPELYNSTTKTWRTLPGAIQENAYGSNQSSWFYPRAWPAPNGNVFVVSHTGMMFSVGTSGDGSVTRLPGSAALSNPRLPSLMYQPGKILRVLTNNETRLIDIQGPKPLVQASGPISQYRQYGNLTLLADGKVWANGGGINGNVLDGALYGSETWDPASGSWSPSAAASKTRLYHSTSLLLPDATVLTAGGGAPGPVINLNAEIYYPPYLYKKDGSGEPADRPTIDSAPAALGWDQAFNVTVSGSQPIARVTLIRAGATTHTFNNGQVLHELPFTVDGNQLTLRTPASRNLLAAGYYLLFVIDAEGVPSVARIVSIL
jgi:hypothetical protein